MSAAFINSTPGLEPEILRFLTAVFTLPDPPPPNLSHAAIVWKYFEGHPLWPEGRSYILNTPEGIAAHGCVSPLRYGHAGKQIESLQVIDWAAGRLVPGAGLLVYRKCLELNRGTLLAIGGSADTAAIIPQVKWFRRKTGMRTYARPLRPWRGFGPGDKGPRSLARFGRNLMWKFSPGLPSAAQWTSRPARPHEEVFSPGSDGTFIPIVRTRAWFDYLLRCPVARTELVILENAGRPAGHAFLASSREGAVRVADFVVPEESGRLSALSALVHYVAGQPGAVEMVAASSIQEICGVFESAGFRYRSSVPVYLADPRKQLPPEAEIEVTPLIGDAFYLFDPNCPFVC